MGTETEGQPYGSEESLSSEHAEQLVLRYVGAYNDRDLEAMLAVLDENIVSHPTRLFETRVHRGHADVRAWWAEMVASGRWYKIEIREVRRVEPDRVALLGELRHGGEYLSPWCVVVRIRGGLIVESRSYLSRRELLEQLGILE